MTIMVGCNNPLNKSIAEELSMEEIKTISKKDNGFISFYDKYFENKCYEYFLKDKTMCVLYSDITYNKFYNYVTQINDESFVNSVYNEAEQEWNTRFSDSESVFDSIIAYWRNHITENSLETYVDIEFDHATTYKEYDLFKGIRSYFKIYPPKGELLSVSFHYTIEHDSEVVFSAYTNYNHEISKPIVISHNERIFSDNMFYDDLAKNKLSNNEIKKKYQFNYNIESIETQEGGRMSSFSNYKDVPFIIKEYIHNPSLSYKESILKEYYNNNYVSLLAYQIIYLNQKMEEKDSMCYNFYRFIIDCKKAL